MCRRSSVEGRGKQEIEEKTEGHKGEIEGREMGCMYTQGEEAYQRM